MNEPESPVVHKHTSSAVEGMAGQTETYQGMWKTAAKSNLFRSSPGVRGASRAPVSRYSTGTQYLLTTT